MCPEALDGPSPLPCSGSVAGLVSALRTKVGYGPEKPPFDLIPVLSPGFVGRCRCSSERPMLESEPWGWSNNAPNIPFQGHLITREVFWGSSGA